MLQSYNILMKPTPQKCKRYWLKRVWPWITLCAQLCKICHVRKSTEWCSFCVSSTEFMVYYFCSVPMVQIQFTQKFLIFRYNQLWCSLCIIISMVQVELNYCMYLWNNKLPLHYIYSPKESPWIAYWDKSTNNSCREW